MDKMIYKITLADGTVISDLMLNGNNYISKAPVDGSIFANNCSPVKISDGIVETLHSSMELVRLTENNGEFWFILRDLSSDELARMQMQSDLEYVAMMAGVEL